LRGNKEIKQNRLVDIADRVLVVWDGVSSGSLFTIEYAQKTGKEIIIVCEKVQS
jgi:predicted Rossmann fold nucleotide-binding protein DprA/Smf involved in DNA uptake